MNITVKDLDEIQKNTLKEYSITDEQFNKIASDVNTAKEYFDNESFYEGQIKNSDWELDGYADFVVNKILWRRK